jgi:membrane-associated phospholipid phosphatase
MPASFDGNDGNDGNSANAGGGGNATSSSGGWFFADRVNLPLVTAPDTAPGTANPNKMIGVLPTINIPLFPDRNWSAEWYSWLALNEFAATPLTSLDPSTQASWPSWVSFPTPPADWSALNLSSQVQAEITGLVTAAMDERADALAEILSQADEFISYFLNMMTARPAAYPETTKVLAIASLIGTFVAMYFKYLYRRPRPSQLCPALLPPIEVPGHASFPSGHSTQAHLMALSMNQVLSGLPQQPTMGDDLWTLADRIARNREIAGLHYPSDTAAGVAIAQTVFAKLMAATSGGGKTKFQEAIACATREWQ